MIEIKRKNPLGKEKRKTEFDSELSIIDKIIEIKPELAKDRDNIINKVIGVEEIKQDTSNNINKKEIVLRKFYYKDFVLYRDDSGGIIDTECNLIGTYKIINNDYIYSFFDRKKYK
jgi:hypothetical protein